MLPTKSFDPFETKTVQKYKMHGFRFFQSALETLKVEVYSGKLDASALATYIGLVSECDNSGLLNVDLTNASIADKLSIPRQTCNTGLQQLLDLRLIRERFVNNKTQYEVIGYGENNVSREESFGQSEGLNYFVVPFEIFNTTVIAKLVSSKEAKGLIFLLDLLNGFTRELQRNKKSPSDYTMVRKTETLKRLLDKPSAIRVRKVLDNLSELFTFKAIDAQERTPRNLVSRVRKAVTQIWVTKYEIHLKPGCIQERPVNDVEASKAIKDAEYRLRALKLPLYQKDKIGIRAAYKSAIKEIAGFIDDNFKRSRFLRESMQDALESLEKLVKTNEIKSIGAFINSQLQRYAIEFLNNETGIRNKMSTYYQENEFEFPSILIKYIHS